MKALTGRLVLDTVSQKRVSLFDFKSLTTSVKKKSPLEKSPKKSEENRNTKVLLQKKPF